MADVEEYGADLAAFRRRVEELRTARALPSSEALPALDAALFELQHAAEVLWPRYEELAAAGKRNGGRDDAHEHQLLRALFQRLPVAVALLDRDGVVRRLNVAATQLFGMRPGYATGRALAGSFTHEGRPTFRSQVAAVARGEGARSLHVQLLRPPDRSSPRSGALRATLTALRPPQEPRTAVLTVFQTCGDAAPSAPDGGGPAAVRREPATAEQPATARPALTEMTRHAELLDLIDDMATALLTAPPARDAVAARAAAVLYGRFADWVILDTGGKSESLCRSAVLASSGEVRDAVSAQVPAASPVVADAVDRGAGVLQARLEDPDAFGCDETGAPLLVRAEASSLLCVPLSTGTTGTEPDSGPDSPSTVQGALTLLRTGGRSAFELAEAGAVDRMARHIAFALRRSEM
ncbi:PAS domain-containing protein [Streptomyces sp. NPDC054796]